jgi:hypothetical protein
VETVEISSARFSQPDLLLQLEYRKLRHTPAVPEEMKLNKHKSNFHKSYFVWVVFVY